MSEPLTLTQNIGDVDLSYLQYDGEGETIILLHATGFLPWLWHPVARRLSPQYRILAPYFCDHRVTDPREGGLNWMTLARDMSAFCREKGIASPFLVGHSMGATVLTIADAHFDLNARGMILIEPIFLPQDFYRIGIGVEDHPLASKSIKRRNHWNDGTEALEYLRTKPLFRNWDTEMLELYIRFGMTPGETGGLQLLCSPQREAALFMGGMQYDPWPLLSRVSCPTLVLEGEESENRSYIDLPGAASLFPRGTHRLIPGAGHLIPMEQPAGIAEIIRDFFGGIGS
ncbi:MAG: alpha/beta hydrolase [Deltaproteobacteria bacterium]|nr:alpha/beta hydrolase [Deltaproteobacteria bacterium]